jgi:DNA primase
MNVEELLVSKDIAFIQRGGDYVVRCLNPEHPDKHPSMRIDRTLGIFNCYSCGYKGNLFALFGEKVDQLELRRELLKKKIKQKLAESVGLTLPLDRVLYAGDWRDIRPQTYEKFGAFTYHEDPLKGRICFPITDISGRISALHSRHMTNGQPRYLTTPLGARLPLFPQVEPIKGSIMLVEGLFDMLNLHDKGIPNAICCFGTKNINEDKLAILKMKSIDSIDIFFDGDEPGQNSASNIKGLAEGLGFKVRNICLDGTDPGALLESAVQTLYRKLYI